MSWLAWPLVSKPQGQVCIGPEFLFRRNDAEASSTRDQANQCDSRKMATSRTPGRAHHDKPPFVLAVVVERWKAWALRQGPAQRNWHRDGQHSFPSLPSPGNRSAKRAWPELQLHETGQPYVQLFRNFRCAHVALRSQAKLGALERAHAIRPRAVQNDSESGLGIRPLARSGTVAFVSAVMLLLHAEGGKLGSWACGVGTLVHVPLCLHATVVVPQLFKLYSHLHASKHPQMGYHTQILRGVSDHSDRNFNGCLL